MPKFPTDTPDVTPALDDRILGSDTSNGWIAVDFSVGDIVQLVEDNITVPSDATKEDVANKSTSVSTDKDSNTKYPSVKSVYDWATGFFATIAGSISQVFAVSQLELWHANDTTITRVSAGVVAVEGITLAQTLLPTTATDWATITFNLATNNKHQVTIAGNRTLALSNTTNVPVFSINIKQDATGSRTVTWFSGITWAGGTAPTLSTGANKTDSFGFQQISPDVYLGCVIYQNA